MFRPLIFSLLVVCPNFVLGFTALKDPGKQTSLNRYGDVAPLQFRKLLEAPESHGLIEDHSVTEANLKADTVTDRTKRSPDDSDESGSGLGAIFRRLMRDLVAWLGSLFGMRSAPSGRSSTTSSPSTSTDVLDVEEVPDTDGP